MAFNFQAILGFNSSKFDSGISGSKKKLDQFKMGADRFAKGMNQVAGGARAGAVALAPFTAVVGAAAMTAANFESQMSTVGSVMLKTPEEMKAVTAKAKELGATTQFSAVQAAEGAEFLARAGMSTTQIIESLSGVLDAAASSGVSLAEASDVVAGQLGAFGLAADQAGKVADTFALTTALTNTNFTQLAEAMKFAAPMAKQAGLSLQSTAAAMGVLANAGVKGSLAGTALKNALVKLSDPSEKAIKLFGGKDGFNKQILETVNVGGKLVSRVRPMEVVMANMAEAIGKAKDPLEATKNAAEIFGLRGAAAFSAFSAQMTETVKLTSIPPDRLKAIQAYAENAGISLQEELGTGSINKLKLLRLSLEVAEGAASQMAKLKMDNVKGQFILLQSAVEGFLIETGALLQGPLKSGIQTAQAFFSILTQGFQVASGESQATEKQMSSSFAGIPFQDFVDFAVGVREAFGELKESAKATFKSISEFMSPILGESGMTAKEIGKLVTKFVLVGAIAAPILAGIAAGFMIIGPIITGVVGVFNMVAGAIGMIVPVLTTLWTIAQVVFSGIATVVAGVSLPVLAIIGALVAVGVAAYIFRDKIFQVFRGIKQAFVDSWKSLGPTWDAFTNKLSADWQAIKDFMGGLWEGITEKASSAWTWISEGAAGVAGSIMAAFQGIGTTVFNALTFPMRSAISVIKGLVTSISNTTLGKKALSLAGVDPEQLQSMLATLPGVDSIEKKLGVGTVAKEIGDEGIKQKSLTKSPSAAENANAMVNAQRSAGPQQINVNQTGSQQVHVVVEGKISGNDLNLVQTRAQINQAEKNGKTLSPSAKRKMLANGAQATGG